MINKLFSSSILLTIFVLFPFLSSAQSETVQSAIKERLEEGKKGNGPIVDDIYLFAPDGYYNFYKNLDYHPIWTHEADRIDLLNIINGAYDEGFLPNDYLLDRINNKLRKIEDGESTPENLAELDLLMSDAAVLYTHHLIWGKVPQSDLRPGWAFPELPSPKGLDSLFHEALINDRLIDFYDQLIPQQSFYVHLRSGLKHYRQIEENGGWPVIPEGETLKKGMKHERIITMRKYLSITGDLSASVIAENDSLFDEDLEIAVKHFQFRHNLTQDGAVGKGTLAQMNVTVEDRINTLKINLERARWVMHQLPKDFLIVNIAGFNIRRITDGEVVYFSPVIVGKKYHQSPIFEAKMQYIEINPTWTVPYSISTKEMLPKLQKDYHYLADKNMIIMDRSGKKLDPSTIDFSAYSRGNFPFIIRQEPGPHNALGEVKFIFPNEYSVYIHDTPARSLFGREERAFSHGCIRLQKKWELMMSLMDDPEVWNMEKINEILKSEKTTRINLPHSIDVLILYWTAGADQEDDIFFNKDVYDRDGVVLKALNTPLELDKVK